MSARRIRVLIVEDQAMMRQGLRAALESYPNIEVIGETDNGEEALVKTGKLLPTLVIMDITLPKMDGIAATRLIKSQHPEIVVLGLSVDPKDYEVYAMQKAGAFDVLKKDQAVTDLYAAIQRAVAAVQPVLILAETPQPLMGDSERAEQPVPMEQPVKEPQEIHREMDKETSRPS